MSVSYSTFCRGGGYVCASDDSVDEDDEDGDGDKGRRQEIEDVRETAETEVAVVRQHPCDTLTPHAPQEEAEEYAAKGHGKLCDNEVAEVEESHPEDGH